MRYYILLIILLTLILPTLPSGAFAIQIEYGLPDSLQESNFWDEGNLAAALDTLSPIPNIKVRPETGLAGQTEIYSIEIILPEKSIPYGGGLSFRFPHLFSVDAIVDIEYSDDHPGPDLVPWLAFIYDDQVSVFFEPGQSPPEGTAVTISIFSIGNPTVAGDYQISGLIFNSILRVVAGPTVSEDFAIKPDEPVSLSISPGEPQTVEVGNFINFSANAFDQYGNLIINLEILWTLSGEFDMIGDIMDGILFVTSVGIGKVLASLGDLEAESGLITVTPGEIGYFQIDEYPNNVNSEEEFPSPVSVSVHDKFGNLKTDYTGVVYFHSTDPAAELFYNISNKYQFAINDNGIHEFEGELFTLVTPGEQTISVTDGEVEGTSGIINVKSGLISIITYVENSLAPVIVFNGMQHAFEFDISLEGNTTIQLDQFASRLELHYDTNFLAGFLDEAFTLGPGTNRLKTRDIYIPEDLIGIELTPRLILTGIEEGINRVDTISFGNRKILVSDHTSLEPRVKINTTELETLNPPFLNHSQDFFISVTIENVSDIPIDSISIYIQSEDGSETFAEAHDISLSAIEIFDTSFALTAPAFSVPSIIYKSVISTPTATVLSPVDNVTSITVQSPAMIELTHFLNNASGNFVDFNQPFSVSARLMNIGEAEAGPGEVSLIIDNNDFGIPDSSALTLPIDIVESWELIAPDYSVTSEIKLRLTGIPIDLNSGEPAQVDNESITFPIIVEPSTAELVVRGIAAPAPLIVDGMVKDVFTLYLTNKTENPINVIGINSITIQITDRNDNIISPELILIPDESGGFKDGALISTSQITDNRLKLEFQDFSLGASESDTVVFKAQFVEEIGPDGFILSIDSRDIRAVFTDGPRINQSVPVVGEFHDVFALEALFVVVEEDFEKSLMIKNNPFNPNNGPAEIAYNLQKDMAVNFSIYTLTGEKVYETIFQSGSEGGTAGQNLVYWDGRNDENLPVLNGVYVAVIGSSNGDETYKLKIAVMK